jgi:hypothetical protein
MRLINKIKEACTRNGSGIVVLFCDEAQRYDENEYEWLRDVHDHLDRLQIRLFTFLDRPARATGGEDRFAAGQADSDRRAPYG